MVRDDNDYPYPLARTPLPSGAVVADPWQRTGNAADFISQQSADDELKGSGVRSWGLG